MTCLKQRRNEQVSHWARMLNTRLAFATILITLAVLMFGIHDAKALTALIDGATVSGSPSQEEQAATAQGYAVTVVSGATWAGMTQAQFGAYDLLIIGDPTCNSTSQAAAANAATWAPVVMGTAGGRTQAGNRILIGTDPVFHDGGSYLSTRATIIRDGIAFAGKQPGRTGLYFDASCSGGGSNVSAALTMLSTGSGAWTSNDSPPCGGNVSLIASEPSFGAPDTLTTASLQGWGCSVHESWPTFPTDWSALAVATDTSTTPTCGVDPNTGLSACGQAYILIAGSSIVVVSGSITATPADATNPVGTSHTITAHVTSGGSPLVGQLVTFTVTGQNSGAVGVCSPADCKSDANGDVTFTYTDANGAGDDTIKASFTDAGGSLQSATAQKHWVADCGPAGDCDDGDPCTEDSCDPSSGCVHAPIPGHACDDGVFCNGTDTCDGAGNCTVHSEDPCPGTPCNTTCQEATHSCADPSGTGCDADSNLCTVDVCDGAGNCVFHNSVSCPDDGNACNGSETCNPASGLCEPGSLAAAGTSCDDGVFCNGADTCDGAGSCNLHSGDPCANGAECNRHCNEATATCFDPAASSCTDDQQVCTDDRCDGAGTCLHADVPPAECPKGYALLSCADGRHARARGTLGWRALVGGNACADIIETGQWSRISGDVVSLQTAGLAVRFRNRHEFVDGDVVTAGGTIAGLQNAHIGGRVDTSGTGIEVDECASACVKAQERGTTLASLAATMTLPNPIVVPRAGHQDLTLGADQQVIDVPGIRVKPRGTLRLVGVPATGPVIVRVHGTMQIGYRSHVDLQGLQPEQVLFVADGDIVARAYTHLAGTFVSGGSIRLGRMTSIDGQVVGPLDTLGSLVSLTPHPFGAW